MSTARAPETYDRQMNDSEMIFRMISGSDFDNYQQAEQAVVMLYVPDVSFSRAGISHALKRLEAFYAGRERRETRRLEHRMNDQAIEQEIQAKGLTAPRVTPADIEAAIASESYFTAADGVAGKNMAFSICEELGRTIEGVFQQDIPHPLNHLTFCVLVLRNGTKIVGINYGPVSPENFNSEQGRTEARAHAVEQVWPLMGYALRDKLASQPKPVPACPHDGREEETRI